MGVLLFDPQRKLPPCTNGYHFPMSFEQRFVYLFVMVLFGLHESHDWFREFHTELMFIFCVTSTEFFLTIFLLKCPFGLFLRLLSSSPNVVSYAIDWSRRRPHKRAADTAFVLQCRYCSEHAFHFCAATPSGLEPNRQRVSVGGKCQQVFVQALRRLRKHVVGNWF